MLQPYAISYRHMRSARASPLSPFEHLRTWKVPDNDPLAVLAADLAGFAKHAEKNLRFELFVLTQAFFRPKVETISFSEQPE